MKELLKWYVAIIVFAGVCGPAWCQGMTVTSLKTLLNKGGQGDKITLVDVRNGSEYSLGHIPNAINVPARSIARKPLPPLGRVVVYGDGLRRGVTLRAVDALNAKEGIQAEMLDGGFAAWTSMALPTTERGGVKRERFQHISYNELQEAVKSNDDIVLVDMRRFKKSKSRSLESEKSKGGDDLTDLSEAFPGMQIIRIDQTKQRLRRATGQVLVLIDGGGGEAEKMARRLHASGTTPVFILTGGEEMLKRAGRSGLGGHRTSD